LYEAGRATQVAREMDRYHLDVLGLSEVRWNTSGITTLSTGHVIAYSGAPTEDDEHRNGVGLMMSKRAERCLIEWEPINERNITARFHARFQKISVVQCYAPTNPTELEKKEEFYNQVQRVMRRIPKRDVVIVMGDLNAKVGDSNLYIEKSMGRHGLGGKNENGEMLIEFCEENELVIGGTLFCHPRIHKATWKSPDQQTENQIDHMMISRRWRSNMQDVRTYRGADAYSDHFLVIGKFKAKIAALKKQEDRQRRRFDVSNLKKMTPGPILTSP
jgi:exonuclease III